MGERLTGFQGLEVLQGNLSSWNGKWDFGGKMILKWEFGQSFHVEYGANSLLFEHL